jgi:hypothetical protein
VVTAAIHQPQYLPYLGFFHKLQNCDVFVLLDDAQFSKGGFQNRNRIKSPDGWQWLTVPVLHRAKQAIREVEINGSVPWRRKHWSALVSNYSRAPHFERYVEELQRIFAVEWKHLASLNEAFMEWAMNSLGIGTDVRRSSEIPHSGTSSDRLIELCRAIDADRYLSGPGGRDYMDLDAFERAGIEIVWQEFMLPSYPQQFPEGGFIENLSSVDALFNCGPDTRQLLA